jgi:GT2 family glycosyltransferase
VTPVTIVILNWNGKKWLRQFLPSVVATQYDALTVLVADNGSTDDSVEILRKEFPSVKVLELGANHGFAKGNNLAVEKVDTPYYVLLNNDVEVPPNWLKPLVELMDRDSSIAAAQPKLLAFDEKTRFEYAGGAGGFVDRFGYAFCRGRLFDMHEQDQGQYDGEQEIFWATGACCIVRKSVTDEIGLFDDELFAHQEEIDFCWRARIAGHRIVATSASVAYHVGGGTLQRSNPHKTFLNARNNLIIMIKNLHQGVMPVKVFLRACLDGVWAIRSLLRGDLGTLLAILKAHWAVWLRTFHWLGKRRKVNALRKPRKDNAPGYYRGSIVWQHFAKGVKKFSDLKGIEEAL